MVNIVQNDNLEEYQSVWTDEHMRSTADATGQTVIRAAGHHPRCRLVKARYHYVTYSTAGDIFAIEELTGTDHATLDATSSPAVGKTVDAVITDDIFERNEAICVNLTTDGNAANSGILKMTFESVHS